MNDITSEGGQDMSIVTDKPGPGRGKKGAQGGAGFLRVDALQKIVASLEAAEWPGEARHGG
jgi:hypothetical protein